jgi:DNA-binding Lrp family transcriptional regulator
MLGSLLRDDLDRQIVALLSGNARLPYPAIGEQIGLSAPAVKRRIDRLLADGTIRAFTVTVEPDAVGAGTEAFVELHCRGRTTPEHIRQLALAQPAVVGAYTVTGEADALLHVQCADTRELEETLERLRADDAVVRTTSTIVLSRLVERQRAAPGVRSDGWPPRAT